MKRRRIKGMGTDYKHQSCLTRNPRLRKLELMRGNRAVKKEFLLSLALIAFIAFIITPCAGGEIIGTSRSEVAKQKLPKEKQTTAGLYVTAEEAYEKWKAAPEKVKILDVRTPEEYLFVGHPEMAWNIPLAFQTYNWDAARQDLAMKPNPDFVSWAKEWFSPNDTLLVMCRSGGRSALAVNQLLKAGFKDVYNIIDGMEGDMVKDPENVFREKG